MPGVKVYPNISFLKKQKKKVFLLLYYGKNKATGGKFKGLFFFSRLVDAVNVVVCCISDKMDFMPISPSLSLFVFCFLIT